MSGLSCRNFCTTTTGPPAESDSSDTDLTLALVLGLGGLFFHVVMYLCFGRVPYGCDKKLEKPVAAPVLDEIRRRTPPLPSMLRHNDDGRHLAPTITISKATRRTTKTGRMARRGGEAANGSVTIVMPTGRVFGQRGRPHSHHRAPDYNPDDDDDARSDARIVMVPAQVPFGGV